MTITDAHELESLKIIGRIVANTLQAMRRAAEPGMTTAELDALGRGLLAAAGATSAPESCYAFPGATCISVNEEIAHGIPGPRLLRKGDLINIDVSAEKDGFFADTGASFVLGGGGALETLCRDGRRAMEIGIAEVGHDRPLAGIGRAIGQFAQKRGYTLVRNLASHGVGRALHEAPEEIPTWPTKGDRRKLHDGLVLTVEPFLSHGATWAETDKDEWTLYGHPSAPTVQFEHTVVTTRGKPIIVTLPG